LLAEDNKFNQMVLRKLISGIGFKVTVVTNGQECVDTWSASPDSFSVILMDLQMPVKDGFQATQEIREIERKTPRKLADPLCAVPIIALTATTYPTDLEKSIACGMNTYLIKPVSQVHLEECLFRILSNTRI